MDGLFTIGKLSKMTGVSTRSIRHYEKIGILSSASCTEANYRLFGEEELKRLQQICLLRSLDFSLNEILDILTGEEDVEITNIFDNRLKKLDLEVTRLNKSRDMLKAVTRIYKTNGLQYIDNFHMIKEIVSMNTKFIRVFNRLELQTQIKILKELYRTGTLQPETLREIGETNGHLFLEELHLVLVKSLLNGVDFHTEKNIMEKLRVEDPEFANVAMGAMFTFDDIGRLPDITIEKWAMQCEDSDMVVALKDCNNYLINKVLSNMPVKRANQLRMEIDNQELVSLDESFQTMTQLIEVLRGMEQRGEIVIERFKD